jgi:peptide chain release factor 2
MVKDLRTGHETGNAQGVLDGDLDGFIRAELERRTRGDSRIAEPISDAGGED